MPVAQRTSRKPAGSPSHSPHAATWREQSGLRLSHRLLSADEERGLFSAYRRTGDLRARRTLVESNMKLVRKEVREAFENSCCSVVGRTGPDGPRETTLAVEDLEQEGVIGLLRAVEDFEPDRGMRFSTYATYRIRSAVTQLIWDMSGTVKITSHMRSRMGHYVEARKKLMEETGREPTRRSVAGHIGSGCKEESVRSIESALSVSQRPASFEAELDGGQEADLAGEEAPTNASYLSASLAIQARAACGSDDYCLEEEVTRGLEERALGAAFAEALEELPERLREVLIDRYGLFGRRRLKLREIASREGVCEVTIHERQNRARKLLARALKETLGGSEKARELYLRVAA